MNLPELLARIESTTGKRSKAHGKNYACHCPAHDDHNPSLSVSESSDGKLLMKCHKGCSFDDICESLQIEPSDLSASRTFESATIIAPTYYEYLDEDGQRLFRKTRYHNPKSFKLERWENDNWVAGLSTTRRVLYQLSEVLKGVGAEKQICIVEGEKDVETLRIQGLIATTNFDGAGKWNESYTKSLKGAHIILFYDYDTAGVKHRDLLIQKLKPVVKSLKIVELGYSIAEKYGNDITDWFCEGHTKEQLFELINQAIDLCKNNVLKVMSFHELMEINIPEPRFFISPFMQEGSLGMVYAKRGVGKTMFGLEVAYAISSGGSFLRYQAPEAVKILYIDGEMPINLIKNRLLTIKNSEIHQPKADHFLILSQCHQETQLPSLGTLQFESLVDPIIDQVNVVVIDNLATLATRGDENEGKDWVDIQRWILDLRRRKKAVLLIHHAGKNGNQRGTSKREDTLDYSINLSHPENYEPSQGARFVIEYEKQRNLFGDDVKRIEASMVTEPDETRRWEFSDYLGSTEKELYEAKRLQKSGKSLREIEQITGIKKSTLQRKLKSIEDVPESQFLDDETVGQEETAE